MARMRSPSYPNLDLPQAVELVGQLYAANRTFPMDRDVAAKEMGYSGLTGPSAKKIATLIQYGLLEKYARNEVQVSKVAEAILHPDDQVQKEENLKVAAYMPRLFTELRERFPGGMPSESNLKSYLLKQGFSDGAVGPAIKAYLGTCSYIEKEYLDETCVLSSEVEENETIEQGVIVGSTTKGTSSVQPLPHIGQSYQPIVPNLNAMNVEVFGGQIRINVLLDSKGLDKLERKMAALRELIADEDETGVDEDQAHSGPEEA